MNIEIPRFDRRFLDGIERITAIGGGAIGGKASGLLRMRDVLARRLDPAEFPELRIEIPTLAVLGTEVFEAFVERNGLAPLADADLPDDRIAEAFQRAAIPAEIVGDLRALIQGVHTPLAIRSSSLLEDALAHPFAGVYGTKMIPNYRLDADTRFLRLVEAVKFVWATTWFAGARGYARSVRRAWRDERMAVIVQEIVGARHGNRFYPDVSGVARSYAFYRSGRARPEEGVAVLALGLGKTIVDGGTAWSYSPAHPRVAPPFPTPHALLDGTQRRYWAVSMAPPEVHDPIRETEYLVQPDLAAAEADGTLRYTASTYDPASDRLMPGTGRTGPRAITFAPLLALEEIPLNAAVRRLLAIGEEAIGRHVEIEFAATLGTDGAPPRLGFLQVRPMSGPDETVTIPDTAMNAPDVLLASEDVMGNGVVDSIRDIVYVRSEGFGPLETRATADELVSINARLLDEERPCLLIGFGRWGSSDPSLGIPVRWDQIAAARCLVEATLPSMNVEASQGSHFFHNISSFGVSYFSVRHDGPRPIDWSRLDALPAIAETRRLRHVRLERPLVVEVDGRTGRGRVRFGG